MRRFVVFVVIVVLVLFAAPRVASADQCIMERVVDERIIGYDMYGRPIARQVAVGLTCVAIVPDTPVIYGAPVPLFVPYPWPGFVIEIHTDRHHRHHGHRR